MLLVVVALAAALLAASLLARLAARLSAVPPDPGVVVTTWTPSPTPPAESAPASAEPSPGDDATGLPERTWPALPAPSAVDADGQTLQRSVLYSLEVPVQANCPAPARAGSMEDLTRLAGGQLDCLQDAWAPVLADLGVDPAPIPYYFYDAEGVDTPCGWVEAPALYCSAQGGAIYFGLTALDGTSWYDLGVKEVAGHEYGHRLQDLAGMMSAAASRTGNEPLRRLELQATCFAYAQIIRDTSVTITDEVFESIEPYLLATIDDGVHGSPESVAQWGLRGLYAETLADCNTWVVPSGDVE